MFRFFSGVVLLGLLAAGCTENYYALVTPASVPAPTDAGRLASTPVGCDPTTSTGPVDDTCGVFVSSKGSDTTGNGTKGLPYQTLAKALDVALATAHGPGAWVAGGPTISQPVYACGETFTVTESVALSAKVDLYGALDCSKGWAYDGANKTVLQADTMATPIPLTLSAGASGSSLHDFAITAAEATTPGGSSIAVLDDGAELALENVVVTAGAAGAGYAGAVQSQVVTPTSADGGQGAVDSSCHTAGLVLGGAGGTNTCDGTSTNGGTGGPGAPFSPGEPAGSGLPIAGPNGGTPQTATGACTAGGQGTPGMAGTPGTGARGIGDVSASGYDPPAAAHGGSGGPGRGGGGGGGAYACDPHDTPPMFAGPGGGGGGAGGCGGAPGNPGNSGGSSIAILVLGGNLTLTNVTIEAARGGTGGDGGDGQPGGAGGRGGLEGFSYACPGGPGGTGGNGGPGGGGAGGHSVGIAIKGGVLPALDSTTIGLGGGGMGGWGGDGDLMSQTKGDDGKACKTLDFNNPTTGCAT